MSRTGEDGKIRHRADFVVGSLQRLLVTPEAALVSHGLRPVIWPLGPVADLVDADHSGEGDQAREPGLVNEQP